MQSLSEDEKRQVLGSVLSDQLAAIQEAVKNVPEMKKQLDKLTEDFDVERSDVKIIKAAMTDMSEQVNDHERQIQRLQAI